MRTPKLATRSVRVLAVPLLIAGAIAAVAPDRLPPGPGLRDRRPPSSSAAIFRRGRDLRSNAWAVGGAGSTSSPKTLVVHWNGTAWKQVPSPAPADSSLSGVAATSASNAWAVGCTVLHQQPRH